VEHVVRVQVVHVLELEALRVRVGLQLREIDTRRCSIVVGIGIPVIEVLHWEVEGCGIAGGQRRTLSMRSAYPLASAIHAHIHRVIVLGPPVLLALLRRGRNVHSSVTHLTLRLGRGIAGLIMTQVPNVPLHTPRARPLQVAGHVRAAAVDARMIYLTPLLLVAVLSIPAGAICRRGCFGGLPLRRVLACGGGGRGIRVVLVVGGAAGAPVEGEGRRVRGHCCRGCCGGDMRYWRRANCSCTGVDMPAPSTVALRL
jgi:hypothetical protein